MKEHEPLDFLDDWQPPMLCHEAATWLVDQISDTQLLKIAKLLVNEADAHEAFSGFRLNRIAVSNPKIRSALQGTLARMLVVSSGVRLMFFFFTFPKARWFKWAEFLEALDEDWLVFNWRSIIRATKDLAVAVGMAIDDRMLVAQRGQRLLLRPSLWKANIFESKKKDLVPDAIRALFELMPDAVFSQSGQITSSGDLTFDKITEIEELKTRNKKLSLENQKLKKSVSQLDKRLESLEKQLEIKRKAVTELKQRIRLCKDEYSQLQQQFDGLLYQEKSRLYAEVLGLEELHQALWKDLLKGDVKELSLRVERALSAQRAVDLRYGTKSIIREKIHLLKEMLFQVESALTDAIYPASALLKIRQELKAQISSWQTRLADAPSPSSPIAQAILDRAKMASFDDQGIEGIKELLRNLDSPILSMLLDVQDKTIVKDQLDALIQDRKRLLQARLVARHMPARVVRRKVVEISSLSSFVVRHRKLCKQAIIFVDGYNVIKTSAEWAREDRQGFTKARERFCQIWYERSNDWFRVELVFDGQEQQTRLEERGGLLIVYTDTRFRSQKADLYIQERMKELKEKDPERPLFLITADRGLRDKVSDWADYFVEPRWALIHYLSL